MAAVGLVILVTVGSLGLAVAILIALSTLRGRRLDLDRRTDDPELVAAMTSIQADIDKGQRGY